MGLQGLINALIRNNSTQIGGYAAWLAENWGLYWQLAGIVAISQAVAYVQTGRIVRVVSGYRDPARQRRLQNLWDSGNRTGLVARPADRSWHMQGLAIDVSRRDREAFTAFRNSMEQFQGIRWGGNFRTPDPVHFDMPIGKAKSINQLLSG